MREGDRGREFRIVPGSGPAEGAVRASPVTFATVDRMRRVPDACGPVSVLECTRHRRSGGRWRIFARSSLSSAPASGELLRGDYRRLVPGWVHPWATARVCLPSDEGRPPDGGPALAETFLTESIST
ncbi:hypothetical protein GCM10010232_16260 [Streptomyces amakusaensis]